MSKAAPKITIQDIDEIPITPQGSTQSTMRLNNDSTQTNYREFDSSFSQRRYTNQVCDTGRKSPVDYMFRSDKVDRGLRMRSTHYNKSFMHSDHKSDLNPDLPTSIGLLCPKREVNTIVPVGTSSPAMERLK